MKPCKENRKAYKQLWKVTEGAVADAFNAHPDYLSNRGHYRDTAQKSITKRVVGALMGYAVQTAQGPAERRSSSQDRAETDGREFQSSSS